MFPLRCLFLVEMILCTGGWNSGCEPHSTIKKRSIVYWSSYGSDQAVRIEELLEADLLELTERSDHMGVVSLHRSYDSRR